MNVLDPAEWNDEDDFLARFGKGMPTFEQVQDLQVSLPHLRCSSDLAHGTGQQAE